jgi:hypothetical protein
VSKQTLAIELDDEGERDGHGPSAASSEGRPPPADRANGPAAATTVHRTLPTDPHDHGRMPRTALDAIDRLTQRVRAGNEARMTEPRRWTPKT